MRTRTSRVVGRAAAIIVGIVGVITLTPAATAAKPPMAQEHEVVEELLWTESVFAAATPGSPAQFRARESIDALRLRIEQSPTPR